MSRNERLKIWYFLQVCLAAWNFGTWQNSVNAGVFMMCGFFAIAEITAWAIKTNKTVKPV